MRREVIAQRDPKSPVSEVFRTLRTNIQFMNTDKKLKTLLVTSTFPGEGKSWVASNLAVTFAQSGKRVLIIDADMRKGRLFNIFGIAPKPGLSNYLSGMDSRNEEVSSDDIIDYIQETEVENLYAITAGNVPPNPSELLVSEKMLRLLKKAKEMCDLVIIDGTPSQLVTDSIILSRIVDSTIIVTAYKQTKKENLKRIVQNIKNVGGKISGIVVNKMPISAKKYSESYYYGSVPSSSKSHNNQFRNINGKPPIKNNAPTTRVRRTTSDIESNNPNRNNVKIENSNSVDPSKADEILKQINSYLEKEKQDLNKGEK